MQPPRTPQQALELALQLHRAGRLDEAIGLYRQVLAVEPHNANALQLCGTALQQAGRLAEAIPLLQRAVALAPGEAGLLSNLGEALRLAGRLDEAYATLQQAVALAPGHAGALNNLGNLCRLRGERDAAEAHLQRAVALRPELAQAHFNLGLVWLDGGDAARAAEAFRRTLALQPGHEAAASNLLYVLNLLPGLAPSAVAQAHLDWARRFPAAPPAAANAIAGRPLRLGYLSRDLCAHAVTQFLEPVLEHHDRQAFELFVYSDVERPDETTRRLAALLPNWRETVALTHARLAQLIREDQLDLLVELGGHTEKNRLPVLAARPAPRQLSWLGYPATSGLAAIDYRIVDAVSAPPGEPFPGSEAALRLPGGFACWRPAAHAPEVGALPALAGAGPTFGSFHKLDKLNGEVIALWSRLLASLPESRLMIFRDELDEWQQARLARAFAGHGVAAGRLRFRRPGDGGPGFLDSFGEVDIALDAFPWSGHTIACNALWQGVPVVTLAGPSHASRMVASVLAHCGLPQWIAASESDYLDIAQTLAADLPALARTRASLRSRLVTSPLRDETGFTRALEAAYRQICGQA